MHDLCSSAWQAATVPELSNGGWCYSDADAQAIGGGGGGGGCISVSKVKHGAGGDSPDSAAVQQLLHVVEGLEEELFSSEARRNDAEVGASTVLMLNMSSLL